MFILNFTNYGDDILGIFSNYSDLYDYAEAYSENRCGEDVREEDNFENELSFVSVETNVITSFEIIEAPFQPNLK